MSGMPGFNGGRNRGDTTMSSSGTGVNASAVVAYLRAGNVTLNVDLTTTASISVGAVLFNIPGGFRPPATMYGDLLITSSGAPVRVHIDPNGQAITQAAIASGATLRGLIPYPV